MFEGIAGVANIMSGVVMSQDILVLAMHLKSTDSIDLVLAFLDQCIISNVQRTANATETTIA